MATASQKITEIKFLVLMRGALTPPPMMLTPVVWIPLHTITHYFKNKNINYTYTAAPTTERATDRPMPTVAHMWGEVSSRNLQYAFRIRN